MKVSVFGNLLVKKDSLVVKMVPALKKALPKIDFVVEDPTEGLKPPSENEWIILDAAEGIDEVMVIEDLDNLESLRRSSVHDYDLAMELKLLKKINRLGKVKIVLVPIGMERKKAEKAVVARLKELPG